MESYHGYRRVILGMRNSHQGKRRTWSNWNSISALLSGNQSQLNFEILIAMETNYEQQDPNPLIKVRVDKMSLCYRWGNTGTMNKDVQADFLPR